MTTIGLLGAGTVGSALIKLLAARDELDITIGKALVRDRHKPREFPEQLLTTDPDDVLDSSDLLVEVMGGVTLASTLMLRALEQGLPVVTANKAALAERWCDFVPYMQQGRLYFEAAVMAGTPVINPITSVLRGSRPIELHAILNGTCNYILGALERGVPYASALSEAQRLGYAEADPTLDVGGFDAAHKLTLLAKLAFDPAISWAQVKQHTKGISHLTPALLQDAMQRGGRIRLVGSIYPANGWTARVRPVFLPGHHPLAQAASNRNALYFRGDAVGEVMITGAGAGGAATASGVLADVITALAQRPGPAPLSIAAPLPEMSVDVLEAY
jgi:homoserine dehydrogenase